MGFYKKRETGFLWVGPFGFTQNLKQMKATHSMDLERKLEGVVVEVSDIYAEVLRRETKKKRVSSQKGN
ncbi:unnamed protein product [Sphenostylis stenocarpa]|uniref:Uncharacterized protein n=1 Tax=Sphenostylis stenocarpa TaxID=92480 RepID=A0AA86VGK6_9FABA|nr:unnamed protein product [Sphenostylis stenocarpa]